MSALFRLLLAPAMSYTRAAPPLQCCNPCWLDPAVALTGGCNGARIRFQPYLSWPANAGLAAAIDLLTGIKHKFGDVLSWAGMLGQLICYCAFCASQAASILARGTHIAAASAHAFMCEV